MNVSPDVLRLLVPRLTLWDARSLQLSHPSFVPVVHEQVALCVERALKAARPQLIDAFLKTPPGFRERVHGDFVMLRTRKDVTVQHAREGVAVVLRAVAGVPKASVEVRVFAGAPWPTFATLERTLMALRWFAAALRERGVADVQFNTRAFLHHPVSEVVNLVATQFVEQYLAETPDGLTSAAGV